MFRYLLFFITGCCFTVASSQEALFQQQEIISPEIHDDKTVTFRLLAPQSDSVFVTGDFLPPIRTKSPMGEVDAPNKAFLSKDESGVWSYRTEALPSELYHYHFIVDGIPVTDPNHPFLIRDVASVSNIFIIEGDKASLYEVRDVPHGTVSHRWFDSPTLGMDRRLTVYTPPGYETSLDTTYPVLYLLHGAGGDEGAWPSLGRAVQIMDNLISEGAAVPMIVVMPNGNVIQDAAPGEGHKGFYKPQFMMPETMNGRFEESFKDIMNFVESQYRVKADKAHRAIAGLSMGGFHTLHISRFYPNTFDYMGLFSAAILEREDATGKVYSNIDQTLKEQMQNGYRLYWIGMGKTDFLYDTNKVFRAKLDRMGMPYTYVETEGGHTWRNWRVYLSEFTPQLFK